MHAGDCNGRHCIALVLTDDDRADAKGCLNSASTVLWQHRLMATLGDFGKSCPRLAAVLTCILAKLLTADFVVAIHLFTIELSLFLVTKHTNCTSAKGRVDPSYWLTVIYSSNTLHRVRVYPIFLCVGDDALTGGLKVVRPWMPGMERLSLQCLSHCRSQYCVQTPCSYDGPSQALRDRAGGSGAEIGLIWVLLPKRDQTHVANVPSIWHGQCRLSVRYSIYGMPDVFPHVVPLILVVSLVIAASAALTPD
ncbi:hypothetical protein EDC04DRAFT_820917 [Pisolithus marmoratus]|nr:hypothetical protein EDC04DRAFT_820917 [Pisolithus marmoratus]